MHKTNETNEFVEILQKLPGEVKKETDATAISGKLNKITSSRDRDKDDCDYVDGFIDDMKRSLV